jgi:hypothetical protein
MPITVALTPVPDLSTRVCQPGDVSLADGAAITIPVNRDGDVRERQATIKNVTFNVKGLTGDEVATLTALTEANLLSLIQGSPPQYNTIVHSGQTYEDCYLVKVTPSGYLTVAGIQVVEQTSVVYESKGRYLY